MPQYDKGYKDEGDTDFYCQRTQCWQVEKSVRNDNIRGSKIGHKKGTNGLEGVPSEGEKDSSGMNLGEEEDRDTGWHWYCASKKR